MNTRDCIEAMNDEIEHWEKALETPPNDSFTKKIAEEVLEIRKAIRDQLIAAQHMARALEENIKYKRHDGICSAYHIPGEVDPQPGCVCVAPRALKKWKDAGGVHDRE